MPKPKKYGQSVEVVIPGILTSEDIKVLVGDWKRYHDGEPTASQLLSWLCACGLADVKSRDMTSRMLTR